MYNNITDLSSFMQFSFKFYKVTYAYYFFYIWTKVMHLQLPLPCFVKIKKYVYIHNIYALYMS